ncbi:hypothetical protein B0T24DRAFT_601988 [Lasiosphaeria ovina]|uniref:Ankyrin n=1 Tax=Lasiosphaeria ovina TaxID=92902 RepID=A0AAE0TX16_9PEZI|nr:hypothetical protein B0T24DRAFT_601988 [Lasiosphaeria ovina]
MLSDKAFIKRVGECFLEDEEFEIKTRSSIPSLIAEIKAARLPIYPSSLGWFLSGETATSATTAFAKRNNTPRPTPCTLAQAQAMLAAFPLREIADTQASDTTPHGLTGTTWAERAGGFLLPPEESAELLVPLARWDATDAPHRLDVARLLLADRAANPNCTMIEYAVWCWTPCDEVLAPLHVAAAQGDVDMVKLLLEFGADPAKKDGHGETAVDMARKKGHDDVVRLLEGLSATVNTTGASTAVADTTVNTTEASEETEKEKETTGGAAEENETREKAAVKARDSKEHL